MHVYRHMYVILYDIDKQLKLKYAKNTRDAYNNNIL